MCHAVSSLFTAYLCFFQWLNPSSPSSAARTRCLTCTPDFRGSWPNTSLLHIQHVLFYHLGTTYMQPMHLSCWRCLRGAYAVVQPTACLFSLRKLGAGSGRRYFGSGLCKVQCRDSACPEVHLQLPQLHLLCSRWYLQHLLQCLQEGNSISHTCGHVSTSWSHF